MLDLELQPCRLAFRPSSAHRVRDGHLCIEEIDTVALAQCLEAPFLLVSRRQIADNLAFISEAFRSCHPRRVSSTEPACRTQRASVTCSTKARCTSRPPRRLCLGC